MIDSFPIQIRAGAFFYYILFLKNVMFGLFSFLHGSSIKRQKSKEYTCYFRDDKTFVLFFHIVVDNMYMLS